MELVIDDSGWCTVSICRLKEIVGDEKGEVLTVAQVRVHFPGGVSDEKGSTKVRSIVEALWLAGLM